MCVTVVGVVVDTEKLEGAHMAGRVWRPAAALQLHRLIWANRVACCVMAAICVASPEQTTCMRE